MPKVEAVVVSPGVVAGYAQRVARVAFAEFGKPTILIMEDVNPSDLLRHRSSNLVGIISESGSRVSHWCIFARYLGIPAVVAQSQELSNLPDGKLVQINTDEKVVRW